MKRALIGLGTLVLLASGCGGMSDRHDSLDIQQVEGTLKLGDQGPEVAAVHDYLHAFGYFPNEGLRQAYPLWRPALTVAPADPYRFSAELEDGVKAFQRFAGLDATGRVDSATLEMMQRPRCAHPEHELALGHANDKFALDSGGFYWTKNNLTYRIVTYPSQASFTPSQVNQIAAAAAQTWSNATDLNLSRTTSSSADIEIGFYPYQNVPNGWPDPGLTAGRADVQQMPTRITMRDSPTLWNSYDLQSVMLHEMGHILGLDHSGVEDFGTPVMYYSFGPDEQRRQLLPDDKMAIGSLYNVWKSEAGYATDLAAGGSASSPSVWATSGNNTIWKWKGTTNGGWTLVPGDGVAIAVDAGGYPWVATSWNWIYRRNSTSATSGSWDWLGAGRDVGSGGGHTWAVGDVSAGSGNYTLFHWNNSSNSWSASDGYGVRVTVDSSGRVWVVRADDSIWRRTTALGSTGSWEHIDVGCALDLGAGANLDIYAIGCDTLDNGEHSIWLWNEQTGNGADTPSRRGWVPLDGFATRITGAPDGRPWVAQSPGYIFRRAPR